jgi:hypothetical protein
MEIGIPRGLLYLSHDVFVQAKAPADKRIFQNFVKAYGLLLYTLGYHLLIQLAEGWGTGLS